MGWTTWTLASARPAPYPSACGTLLGSIARGPTPTRCTPSYLPDLALTLTLTTDPDPDPNANPSQTFAWGGRTVGAVGESTYHGVQGGQLELNFSFGRDGAPLRQSTRLPGWQSLIVTFHEYSADINASLLAPPACFGRTAGA